MMSSGKYRRTELLTTTLPSASAPKPSDPTSLSSATSSGPVVRLKYVPSYGSHERGFDPVSAGGSFASCDHLWTG